MKDPERYKHAHCSLEFVFLFGKYKGKTIKEIANINPDYLMWAMSEFVIHFDDGSDALEYVKRKAGIAKARLVA